MMCSVKFHPNCVTEDASASQLGGKAEGREKFLLLFQLSAAQKTSEAGVYERLVFTA